MAFPFAGSSSSPFGSSTPATNVGLFGQPSASPVFGSSQSQPSIFGSPSPSVFGQTQSSGLFGASAASPFGASTPGQFTPQATSAFGQPTTATPTFGSPQTLTPAFGQSPSPFGQTQASSIFGQSQSTPTMPMFGQQPQSTNLFGQSPQSTSIFGQQQSTPSIFGQSPAQPTSIFGSQPTQSTLGFGQQQSTSIFGQQQQASPFGQAAQSSPFGQPAQQSTSPFGQSQAATSLFGQAAQSSPFGQSAPATSIFGQAQASSPFGQPQQSSAFGSTSIFGQSQPATTPFGSTTSSLFGTTSPSTTSTLFPAQTSSPFGQPASASVFGSAQTQPSMFGQTRSTGLFGQTQSAATPFGQSSGGTSLFGTPQTQASPFGQPQTTSLFGQQTAGAFGQTGSAFSSLTAAGSAFPSSSPSIFGQQNTGTAFGQSAAPSIFGQQSASGFGQPSTTLAFGQPQSTPAFSGFGQPQSASVFGQPQTTSVFGQQQSTSAFGQPQSTSIFGQQQTGSVFGQPQSTSIFGQQSAPAFGQTQSALTFGQPQSTSMFGQQQSTGAFGQTQSTPSIFGQPATSGTQFGALTPFGSSTSSLFPAQSAPAFATSSLFGAPQTQQQLTIFSQPASTSSTLATSFAPPSFGQLAPAQQQLQTLMAPLALSAAPNPDLEVMKILESVSEKSGGDRFMFRHCFVSVCEGAGVQGGTGNMTQAEMAAVQEKWMKMDPETRAVVKPVLTVGFSGLADLRKHQENVLVDFRKQMDATEGGIKAIEGRFQANVLARMDALKAQQKRISSKMMSVMRLVQGLGLKGTEEPLSASEESIFRRLTELQERLSLEGGLSVAAKQCQEDARRKANKLVPVVAGAESEVEVDPTTLAKLRYAVGEQMKAIGQLTGVLKKDSRDVDIMEKDGQLLAMVKAES